MNSSHMNIIENSNNCTYVYVVILKESDKIIILFLWMSLWKNQSKFELAYLEEFAGNQDNHQNFDPSLLPKKLWLIFIPEIFTKRYLKFGELKNSLFFWVGHFEILFATKKMCFIPMKISQNFLGSKDGSKFWWLSWFPAQNNTCINICNKV